MESKRFEIERENIKIVAELVQIGLDILVVLSGGDTPHIGSIAFADKAGRVQTTSLPSHKDYIVINKMAVEIQNNIDRKICVLGGIHIENITKEQIQLVTELCEEMTIQISDSINKYV